jgi:hypothetical protein
MTQPPTNDLLPVWFAIGLVFAIFVGTAAGILAWLGGLTEAAAVLRGGEFFAGTLTLVVLVLSLLCRRHLRRGARRQPRPAG